MDHPLTNFYKKNQNKDGLNSYCIPCAKEVKASAIEARKNDPCTRCGHEVRAPGQSICNTCQSEDKGTQRYGITREEFRELRSRESCEACGRTPEEIGGAERALAIDHNHDTGYVRGVLCTYCNTALGSLLDSQERILGLLSYLNKTEYDESNTLG